MIKKFFVSIGVLFSFFFIFLFGLDKINILAYTNVENTLGTYPIQLDIDNYNRENLLDIENINGIAYIEKNIDIILENGKNYYYCATRTSESAYNSLISFLNTNDTNPDAYLYFRGEDTFNCQSIIINGYGKFNKIRYYSAPTYNQSVGLSFSFTNNMIVENIVDSYSNFFKFGYEAGYSMSLNNPSSSSFTTSISIKSNDNTLYTGNCTLAANTSTLCNSGKVVYIPFNIDNNGYISLNTNIQVVVNDIGPTINYNDSGLYFETVFNAYYKGLPTTKLYFKNSYVMNNLYLSGFNVGINKDINSNVTFYTNNYDNSYSITTNKNVNVATNKIIETSIRSNIEYTDFFDGKIYNFVINTGVPNVTISNNRIYQINVSNLVARVVGSSNTNAPNSSNPDISDKYNTCSAWYDIPCQLGNGFTYVIYEAPIISPVLTFIVSFITMFSSLVSFVDLFRSFGVVFGCFIIYMFIELLHKYSK